MFRRYPAAALALAVSVASPGTAQVEQSTCGDRAAIVERLASKYGESRTGAGLSNSNGIVEVYASEETGTWTIILTLPTGRACLVAAGQNWQDGPPPVTKSGMPV